MFLVAVKKGGGQPSDSTSKKPDFDGVPSLDNWWQGDKQPRLRDILGNSYKTLASPK